MPPPRHALARYPEGMDPVLKVITGVGLLILVGIALILVPSSLLLIGTSIFNQGVIELGH
jgi:hypothetical protein